MERTLKSVVNVMKDKHLHDEFFGKNPRTIEIQLPTELLGLLSQAAYERVRKAGDEDSVSYTVLEEIGKLHPELEKLIVEVLASAITKRENELLEKEPENALLVKTLRLTVANTEVEK